MLFLLSKSIVHDVQILATKSDFAPGDRGVIKIAQFFETLMRSGCMSHYQNQGPFLRHGLSDLDVKENGLRPRLIIGRTTSPGSVPRQVGQICSAEGGGLQIGLRPGLGVDLT